MTNLTALEMGIITVVVNRKGDPIPEPTFHAIKHAFDLLRLGRTQDDAERAVSHDPGAMALFARAKAWAITRGCAA